MSAILKLRLMWGILCVVLLSSPRVSGQSYSVEWHIVTGGGTSTNGQCSLSAPSASMTLDPWWPTRNFRSSVASGYFLRQYK